MSEETEILASELSQTLNRALYRPQALPALELWQYECLFTSD